MYILTLVFKRQDNVVVFFKYIPGKHCLDNEREKQITMVKYLPEVEYVIKIKIKGFLMF